MDSHANWHFKMSPMQKRTYNNIWDKVVLIANKYLDYVLFHHSLILPVMIQIGSGIMEKSCLSNVFHMPGSRNYF